MIGKILIVVFTLNTACSQIFLKQAVQVLGAPSRLGAMPTYLLQAAASPWIWASLLLQIISYGIWIVVLSREKLGVALAISGSIFYLVMACAAWVLYNEALSAGQWLGIACIVSGVLLLGLNPA